MKSRIWLLIILFVFGMLSNLYAASYWIIQKDTQRLLHIHRDADTVKIVESYPVIDFQADYVVNPNDGTCWVTSAFQGQITRYGKGKPFVVSNFGAPMSLALDAEREILWVADGALNQIVKMRLDGTLLKCIQLSTSSRDIAERTDGGLWIATSHGLIVLDSNGYEIKEIERKAKYLSGVPGTNEVWLVYPVNNHLMHLDGDGNVLTEGRLKSLSGIVATKDGGCILLGSKTAFRLDADGTLVGTLPRLDHPSCIVYQPKYESVWILQSQGRELVQLPQKFGQESVTTIAGLRGNNLRVEPAGKVRWIPEEDKPIMPPETTEPPEKIKHEKEEKTKPKVEPEKEETTKEPEESKEEKPKKPKKTAETSDKTKPEKKPSEPEVKEKPKKTKEPKAEKPTVEPESSKPEPESKPTPKKIPEPTVVPAPPTSTLLSEPPKFENGGVVLVELHEGLNSTRVKNVSQAMGRRYVWNFEDKTYTLLLGLSVEAYNSYTNRKRAKWVEMLAEGIHVAKPIAEEFKRLANKNNWTAEQTANYLLAFVQCLPYTVDDTSTGIDEFPRYAFETLVAGGGDCEDTTVLAGSILLVLGYDLIALNPKGHLALGIKGKFHGFYFEHNEIRYYYSETTGTGWKVGEVPEVYRGVPVTLYEIPEQFQP